MLVRGLEDFVVVDTGIHFGYRENVMAVVAEPYDDLMVDAFVDQDVHQPVGFRG